MIKLVPMEDNVIVSLIRPDNKIGSIYIPPESIEKSTLAVVIEPNTISYYRDGNKRKPFLKKGTVVRIPIGTGTSVPESPPGEEWLVIPEDCIYYICEECEDD